LIDSAETSVQRGIQTSLSAVTVPIAELGGQIQQICNYPLYATRDTKNRLNKYGDLMRSVAALMPGNEGALVSKWAKPGEKKNSVAVASLAITSAIVANAQIILTSNDIYTRSQSLSAANSIIDFFIEATGLLDEQQLALDSANLKDRFFTHSKTYGDLLNLLAMIVMYMSQNMAGLKIERRFTIDRYRSPIDVCLSEYGDISYLDLFISSNKLHGNDILLIPSGREVVIYV
jgi:hypothetical protein